MQGNSYLKKMNEQQACITVPTIEDAHCQAIDLESNDAYGAKGGHSSVIIMSYGLVIGRPFHTMPPKDLIVLFCNASKHSPLLCQLFTPIVLY